MEYLKKNWRKIIGFIAIAFIIYVWIKKDIYSLYTTLPQEQVNTLFFTNFAVSIGKVLFFALIILFIKWLIDKFKK